MRITAATLSLLQSLLQQSHAFYSSQVVLYVLIVKVNSQY